MMAASLISIKYSIPLAEFQRRFLTVTKSLSRQLLLYKFAKKGSSPKKIYSISYGIKHPARKG